MIKLTSDYCKLKTNSNRFVHWATVSTYKGITMFGVLVVVVCVLMSPPRLLAHI